jgi:hypothetical protein
MPQCALLYYQNFLSVMSNSRILIILSLVASNDRERGRRSPGPEMAPSLDHATFRQHGEFLRRKPNSPQKMSWLCS